VPSHRLFLALFGLLFSEVFIEAPAAARHSAPGFPPRHGYDKGYLGGEFPCVECRRDGAGLRALENTQKGTVNRQKRPRMRAFAYFSDVPPIFCSLRVCRAGPLIGGCAGESRPRRKTSDFAPINVSKMCRKCVGLDWHDTSQITSANHKARK
jgi:hypothetical protein